MSNVIWRYLAAIGLGVACGFSGIEPLLFVGQFCAEVFTRILKCISVPVVSLSVIVALSSFGNDSKTMVSVLKKCWFYTLLTTLMATLIAAILYLVISPSNFSNISAPNPVLPVSYSRVITEIVPESITRAFLEHKVLSVLLISAIVGVAVGFIKDIGAKKTIISFFKGAQEIFFTITSFIVRVIPIGIFGFAAVSVREFQDGSNLLGVGEYVLVIVLANFVQGAVALPALLAVKGFNPARMFKIASPVLSVAFFSKSSNATLPFTIENAEKNLKIDPKISRFVLPLCTAVNMNACAAFVFVTSIYMMQNNGTEIGLFTMMCWILIATLAAIGNAGVPMGCYFVTVSLLSAIDVPMPLMGLILPIYNLIDMEETALNVWSDTCVTAIVAKEVQGGEIGSV